MNDNVVGFPASNTMTPEQALASVAQFEGLQEILVVGYDAYGDLLIRSSRMSRERAVFLALKAQQWALDGST